VLCERDASWANAAKENSSRLVNIHLEPRMTRSSFIFNRPIGTARERWQSSPRPGRARLPV
jgi:hypothetical protein